MQAKLRIAAFGFRSIPMREGCAGADKFAMELFPRLVQRGHQVIGYNRLYPGQDSIAESYGGVQLRSFRTIQAKGFDTLLHSLKCTFHIIFFNTAKIVHIQNGGNSIWAFFLRIAGKKVFISQDGIDWNRDKWSWYAKAYLRFSAHLTSVLPNQVIFDNIFARDLFKTRYNKTFEFIPFGSDVPDFPDKEEIFTKLGIQKGEYFLFIGRFIPDKGLHYLIPEFEKLDTKKKLVLVGGSPNPSSYETKLLSTKDPRIVFAGFVYGDDSLRLIKNAYCYVQPSDVEGLSPVILNVMGLGTPIICSDIRENIYAVADTATLFKRSDRDSLKNALEYVLDSKKIIQEKAIKAKERALSSFSWDFVTREHERVFMNT
ncbi:MAG: glycosyltransferase family 4 protein [Bacteroidetes bacterium]|nr:glycosyltransferase family 4 protein [Bacteroidota bacterium]